MRTTYEKTTNQRSQRACAAEDGRSSGEVNEAETQGGTHTSTQTPSIPPQHQHPQQRQEEHIPTTHVALMAMSFPVPPPIVPKLHDEGRQTHGDECQTLCSTALA